MAFFGALALTKVVMYGVTFLPHVTVLDPPDIPIEAFNMCAFVASLPFKMVVIILGTVFGE